MSQIPGHLGDMPPPPPRASGSMAQAAESGRGGRGFGLPREKTKIKLQAYPLVRFDKSRVERFIERYEAAADNEDADDKDMARQIINFVTEEEDAMDIEDLLGYRDWNWVVLKAEMLSRWGGQEARHKVGDLERMVEKVEKLGGVNLKEAFQKFWGKFKQTWSGLSRLGIAPGETATKDLLVQGLHPELADRVFSWVDAADQLQRVGGALVLPSLSLVWEAAYKDLEVRGMRKRFDKKRETEAEDFAKELLSGEPMEGVVMIGKSQVVAKKKAPPVQEGGMDELMKQLAEMKVEMAALKASKAAVGPPRV